MTKYYYLIAAGSQWDETVKVYKVGIGESASGKRDLTRLASIIMAKRYYFKKVTLESDQFVSQCLDSLKEYGTSIIGINSRELISVLANGEKPSIPSPALANIHHFRKSIDLNYRLSCNLNQRKS